MTVLTFRLANEETLSIRFDQIAAIKGGGEFATLLYRKGQTAESGFILAEPYASAEQKWLDALSADEKSLDALHEHYTLGVD